MNPYDPGSTWKPVTAMAGMESGKFPPDTKLPTTACITYGGHCFPDHNGVWFRHTSAMRMRCAFSSNTFFYQVGVGVGSQGAETGGRSAGFSAEDRHRDRLGGKPGVGR